MDFIPELHMPVSFYFAVSLPYLGLYGHEPTRYSLGYLGQPNQYETSFSEVTGLKTSMQTIELQEAGNPVKHSLPDKVTYSDLVLKRGIATMGSNIVQWCKKTLDVPFAQRIETHTVIVDLLNPEGEPARSWTFYRAYPVSWETDSFSSTANKLSIETITLKHAGMTRTL